MRGAIALLLVAAALAGQAVPSARAGERHPLLDYADERQIVFVVQTSDAPVSGIAADARYSLELHVLEPDRFALASDEFRARLAAIETLTAAGVTERLPAIEAEAERLAREYERVLPALFQQVALAGELAAKYGITRTPAVLEIRGSRHFRLVERFRDFPHALELLKRSSYATLP